MLDGLENIVITHVDYPRIGDGVGYVNNQSINDKLLFLFAYTKDFH